MTRYHEGIALIIAIAIVTMTLIISITKYEMHRATLEFQTTPQVMTEN